MYIESVDLSDCHAEIKFNEKNRYILKDCNSETGTWTRIGHPGDAKENIYGGSGIDLYQENRMRMYKVGEYQFKI